MATERTDVLIIGAGASDGVAARLVGLAHDEPDHHAALQLVVVAGSYTDKGVRERLGYPGQLANPVNAWQCPAYLDEGLIDPVLARADPA